MLWQGSAKSITCKVGLGLIQLLFNAGGGGEGGSETGINISI